MLLQSIAEFPFANTCYVKKKNKTNEQKRDVFV